MAKTHPILTAIRSTAPIVSRLAPPLAARWLLRLFVTPQPRPFVRREQKWMEGSTRTNLKYDDDIDLPVWSWGDGPTVLLVHGWSGRGSQLAVHARPLVEAGCRVVAWDMPGHGDAGGKTSALPYFARAIQKVADEFGPVYGIVAHSLGAAAVTFALSKGLQAERIVYLAPPENLARYLTYLGKYLRFAPGIAPRSLALLERRYATTLEDVRGRNLAPARTEPLLILHDEDDPDVPLSEARDLAESWPGAELIVSQGLGHGKIVRDEATVRRICEFLGPARIEAG